MIVIWILLFVLLLALLILLFLKQLWSRRHLPPGPLALPLIGTLWADWFWLREDYFLKHAKRYGNIYSMWAGPHLVVVLSGFKTVKEAMTSFPEEFSDRPYDGLLSTLQNGRGIILSNGYTWKQQRHIGITSLRKLGLGKKSIEHQIEDAAQTLVEIFRQTKGQPFDPSLPVLNAVCNIICALSFGCQFAPEDENYQKLTQALEILVNFTGNFFHFMYGLFPQIMKYLPGPHKEAQVSRDLMLFFAKQEIEKHKESYSLHEPQDFIDHYLLQMEKSRNDPNSTYNEENLAQCILDFFAAGTETTVATLMWALLLLTNHPDIQGKVQKEIEDVFGFSRSISYQDRKKLPYTNAAIHEMQRVKYIFLAGAPTQSTKEVNMKGYCIPKGTIIAPNLHSVLLDPEQWETPKEFNPNHFLDKDGKFIEREEFLPFGIGQRSCVGEHLARIEIFIFLTNLLRAFSFRLPAGVKELNEVPVVKVTLHPHPYKLCAIPTQD
ncbi:cytochrome P450 2J5-like [Protobothrops mucrosquamatus]|uniref:cytochrome P450 2J5-like n=1 Tax=Protobothrops mucrosquamatus TaxID=103944 RepID=UPI0010FB2833|nr:cytochrome P450 2J5-like [Protobothrops mucrosquamatus]